MNILFSGGGTGGGVYPALAVIEALRALRPEARVLWVGSAHGVEHELVPRAGVPFEGVAGGPIVGVGLRAIPNALRLLWGTAQALGIVGRFKPDALLITGGWATIAPALACWLRGVPVAIYMPDVEPGSAIQALSRIARRVAVTAEASARHFPGKAVETGYPLRAGLLEVAGYTPLGEPLGEPPPSAAAAREHFGLTAEPPTVLVFGGSRGARSINQALLAQLPDLLPHCQVLHISGTLDAAAVQAGAAELADRLGEALASRYHTYDYLHGSEMALALAAADLAVSRAGASTLGEFPLFALPAILVPYPHAWHYQKTNADYLAARGAAIRLDDEMLNERLAPTIIQLLLDGDARRAMAAAAAASRRPNAAARIARMLLDLAQPAGDVN